MSEEEDGGMSTLMANEDLITLTVSNMIESSESYFIHIILVVSHVAHVRRHCIICVPIAKRSKVSIELEWQLRKILGGD